MDPPAQRPQAAAEPPPAEEAEPQLVNPLAIPPVTYPSDDEVLVVLLLPWQTLTEVLNTDRPWQAQLPIQS